MFHVIFTHNIFPINMVFSRVGMAVTWMKTAPDKRTYQQEASSPWLEKKSSSIVLITNSTRSDGGMFFINSDGSRWRVRLYSDPPSIKSNTTRFQLILPVPKQKPPNFKVVIEW